VLDCGCGPGSITLGIAERVAPARVVGVDFSESQIERAAADATTAGLQNVSFHFADCYDLPFEDKSFDRVFSHALMEHRADWDRAKKQGQF
jgi:ubiquinone/menaquinone biosynthesis C-methylase UbiE